MIPGEVYFCDFPNAEMDGKKERPVVLVAKVFGGDFVCCMVTTVPPNKFDPHIEIRPEDMEDGAMNYYPSFIRPVRIATVASRIFRRRLGKVNPGVLAQVYEVLMQKLAPPA